MIYNIFSSSGLNVQIDTLGAQIVRIYKDRSDCNIDFLWNGDSRYWLRHSPILFPFVGRLFFGSYLYKGKYYPSVTHGFLSHKEFKLYDKGDDYVSFIFDSDYSSYEIYPFDFRFKASYKLHENRLDIHYLVCNVGDEEMHFGIGLHPGFLVPLEPELCFEDYSLIFPGSKGVARRVFSDRCFDTGQTVTLGSNTFNLTHEMFDQDAIIFCETGGHAVLSSRKGRAKVEIFFPKEIFCAVWQPVHTDANFICIEPWWTLPTQENDLCDIQSRKDFIHLRSHEDICFEIGMEFYQ